MSYTMCEVYVAADGTELASDGNVDRVEHPSTGVYNVYCNTTEVEEKVHFQVNARAASGTSDVICQAVTKFLDDGTVIGGQVKFFKNYDPSQPVDCAFELLIQSRT